jgi:microcystin-dependent protein
MSEPFIAEIKIISWNFAPRNWAFCNGQLLPINQNQALFSILGTTYGGNGQTTFALPDFRGRAPIHRGDGYVLGQRGGEEAHTLTISELAAHNHTAACNSGSGTLAIATKTTVPQQHNAWALSTQNPYHSGVGQGLPAHTAAMNPSNISNTGGSQPHTNMQPYLVLNFIIALIGIFPSQN